MSWLYLNQSLRVRLILGFTLLALLTWGAASLLAWYQARDTINEMFDTQQMLFAKRLVTLNLAQLDRGTKELPKTKRLVKHHRGDLDDDALAFAIYTTDGKMVLNDGENGADLKYDYRRDGFTDGHRRGDDDLWRLVWLTSKDHKHRVVVGQEWEYRNDMALDTVKAQLLPWLIALPVMLLLLFLLLSRELAPLRRLAKRLKQRQPDDDSELSVQAIPSEVKPIVASLNSLFHRTKEMLNRERRFTSDAAHELRSPLAALKVQTEVVQLAEDDKKMRENALKNLSLGIDRATRLVDQLLTMSRLDSLYGLEDVESVNLKEILQSAVMDHYHKAQSTGVELILDVQQEPEPRMGQPLLLALLARNLLDNAIRYGVGATQIRVTIGDRGFSVADNGCGVEQEFIERIAERFFRPPGQEKAGSGLGLSIVQRIAALHGMKANFYNQRQGGFRVDILWS
ncbi:quorum sensing histidine kinase QseC [Dongshaea marina]|uniref:quorum sensing histidine kinase QseC n=1 Tax=Dongshaea marina TaxID=2047966 RepID=UPI000D3EC6A5|nr:quorum sensing histidine kinase QseC [Dongshaea marina]